MRELILLKSGEIALKGLNRSSFEDRLIKNCKRKLADLGKIRFSKSQSTIYAEPASEDYDVEEAIRRLQKVFGFSAMSRACVVEKDYEKIRDAAGEYLRDTLRAAKTFKVIAKRSDKSFPMTSPEIGRELGGYLLSRYPHLKVDVNNPELIVMVEIREKAAYVHAGQIPGAGGMPVGTSGKGMLLLSGGIDSPVAAYMMAKRGLELEAIHFAAPPYTSERAKLKVIELCRRVSLYSGRIKLHVVGFTHAQEMIRDNCPEELFTLVMRRYMMKIAEKVACRNSCACLVTGESLAQVASQTLWALGCTDTACQLPVLRPVIGMDKKEIIEIAQNIDTFETSILPYEDCCTVFTPRHPRTHPKLGEILEAEKALDEEALIADALSQVETIVIEPYTAQEAEPSAETTETMEGDLSIEKYL